MKDILNMFLSAIISCILLADAIAYKSSCIDSHCNGPFRLKEYKYHTTIYTHQYTTTKYKFEKNAIKTSIEKRNVRHFLYNGGAIDPNTRQETERKVFNITSDEFRLKKCLVGDVIAPGTAWGSDSSICQKSDTELYKKYVDDREGEYFNWIGTAPFAYHMCVIDWRCKVHSGEMPIILDHEQGKDGVKAIIGTYGMNGEFISICKNDVKNLLENKSCKIEVINGAFHSQIEYEGVPIKSETQITCFGHGKKQLYCKEKDSPGIFKILCPGPECYGVHDDTIITFPHSEKELTKPLNEMKEKNGAASSIEDVIKVQNSLLFFSEELNYDLELLQTDVYKAFNVMNSLIRSLGKIDDELIPNILNKTGKTQWPTPNMFSICPCFNVRFPDGANCHEDHIYDNGRIKKIENQMERNRCVKISNVTANTIDVFMTGDIAINELEFEPPNGTSVNWPGWTQISEDINGFINANTFVNTFTNNSNIFSGILDTNSLFGFWGKFSFIFSTSFVTYLNSVVLLFLLWRR